MRQDGQDIWDMFHRMSERIHLQDRIDRKQAQINSVKELRCGNCDHWMKTSCYREKQLKEFKSTKSYACNDFLLAPSSQKLLERFEAEMAEIKAVPEQPRNEGGE